MHVEFEVVKNEKFSRLSDLVHLNCLIGPDEVLPGLIASQFDPLKFDKVSAFNDHKTIYAHNIKITSMPKVESQFNQYLRVMCAQASSNFANPS